MTAYFGGDEKRLEELVAVAGACKDGHENGELLYQCARLRLEIRKHDINSEHFSSLATLAKGPWCRLRPLAF